MLSNEFDVATRSLATGRSRRTVLGSFFALALTVPRASVSSARKTDKDGRKKRKETKGKGKDKGCKTRHSERDILGFIDKAAKKYGQSKKVMERVARCESGLDPCAVNRRGPYYGLFQFLKSTWKTTPYQNRDIYDPKAQALAAAWMWKEGRKDEWACK